MSFCLIVVFRVVVMLSLPLLFIGSMYAFMWAPQIYRSARRGRSSGLHVEYTVGVTLCRLFFLLCEFSFFRLRPHLGAEMMQTSWDVPRTFWMLSHEVSVPSLDLYHCPHFFPGWIWGVALIMALTVGILALQEYLGSTFFLLGRVRKSCPMSLIASCLYAGTGRPDPSLRLSSSDAPTGPRSTGAIAWRLFNLYGRDSRRPFTTPRRGRREGAVAGTCKVGSGCKYEEELQSCALSPSLRMCRSYLPR